MHLFITGTDTGIGKTHFAAWLVAAWRKQGFHAAGLKPISAGGREDAELLRAAAGGELPLDTVNPVVLDEPVAPAQDAAALEPSTLLARANAPIAEARIAYTHLAVEGVGGWLVPLGGGLYVRDWARGLGLPVVVVARPWLGTLNHTLLTVESIRAAGCACAGIVLNMSLPGGPEGDPSRARNAASLRALAGAPVFEFLGDAQPAGHLPAWLGGKEG